MESLATNIHEKASILKDGENNGESKENKNLEASDDILGLDDETIDSIKKIVETEIPDERKWWHGKEDFVISGISGRYPESENVKEFLQNLYAGVDMVTVDSRRWTPGSHGLPKRQGKLKHLKKFDYEFFEFSAREAKRMDCQLSMMLETTYEAMYDAGINPTSMRGRNIAVYVANCVNETNSVILYDEDLVDKHTYANTNRSLYANKIAFHFDFKGPSMTFDTACSTTFLAIHNAIDALRRGQCEAAIICSAHVTLSFHVSLMFFRMGMLSPTGTCQSFDARGNGYVRGECIGSIFIQRASNARRVYATIVHAKSNTDGYKAEGITFPSPIQQVTLLKETYQEAGVNPNDVKYVEAHGTGTAVGDFVEGISLTNTFLRGARKVPLLIGSVKSNCGHPEPSSGIAALTKVIGALQYSCVPQNLHYTSPSTSIPALVDGRLKVVDKNIPWPLDSNVVALNNFGFGGSNTHIILRANEKIVHNVKFSDNKNDIPTLLLHSGRTKKTLENVFALFKVHNQNLYLYRMLMEQSLTNVHLFPHRGFMISSDGNVDKIEISGMRSKTENNIVCFAYSGKCLPNFPNFNDLMKIQAFKTSFETCSRILLQLGVDLAQVLNGHVPRDQESVYLFLCNVVYQIAMTDVLRLVGVKCKTVIGDSVGEILFDYANGTFDLVTTLKKTHFIAKYLSNPKKNGTIYVSTENVQSQIYPDKSETTLKYINVLHNDFNDFLSNRQQQPIIIQLTSENMMKNKEVPEHCHWVNLSGLDVDVKTFISTLGKLYIFGLNVKVQNLYPEVDYPAPRDTPMLASEFDWNHSEYCEEDFDASKIILDSIRQYIIDPFKANSKEKYLLDHVIDGHTFYPLAGYLVMAWQTFCQVNNKDYLETPIILENVKVHSGTILLQPVKLTIAVTLDGGRFVISNEDQVVASGTVKFANRDVPFYCENINKYPDFSSYEFTVNSTDIYTEFRLRGYEYGPHFRGIRSIWSSAEYSSLVWNDNWITFIDALLQTNLFVQKESVLRVPIRIEYLRIDPLRHAKSIETCSDGTNTVKAHYNLFTWSVIAGGVEIYGVISTVMHARSALQQKPSLEWIDRMLYYDTNCLTAFPRLQHTLHKYSSVCQVVAMKMMEILVDKRIIPNMNGLKSPNIPFSDKNLPFENEVEKYSLLALLHSVYDQMLKHDDITNLLIERTIQFQGLFKAVEHDPLVNFSWNNPVLSDLMDVCLQNLPSNIWCITIVEPESLSLVETISRYNYQRLRTMNRSNVFLKVVGPRVSELGVGNKKSLEYESFNFNIDSDEEFVKFYEKQDILILDRILFEKDNIEAYLAKLHHILDSRGFVLVSEVTGCFELAYILHAMKNRFEPKDLHNIEGMTRKCRLFIEHDDWLSIFRKCGYCIVAYRSDNLMTTSYLLRKVRQISPSLLLTNDCREFSWIVPLKEAIVGLQDTPHEDTVVLVSSNDKENGLYGMLQSFQNEYGKENRTRALIDIPRLRQSLDDMEIAEQLQHDLIINIYNKGHWETYRRVTHSDEDRQIYEETEHAYVNTLQMGVLSSLNWIESPNKFFLPKHDGRCSLKQASVYYAAINFRDVMLSTGRLASDFLPNKRAKESDCLLGIEFVGRCQETGKRIMGIPIAARAIATTVVYDERLCWDIPDDWTMEQAATVPIAYCTAYYALIVRGQIRRGEKILIHAGAGGVGIAAITLAIHYGLEVFATVGNEEKKNFLLQRFPQLDAAHINSSRNTQFEIDIMQATNGEGVDLILNSLSESLLQASLRCLAQNGRFLEIGKFDLAMNNEIETRFLLKNSSFHGIVLDLVFNDLSQTIGTVGHFIAEGLSKNVIKPLPTNVFGMYEVESAFRFMAQGKHIGKVLIKLRDEEEQKLTLPRPVLIRARAQALCNPQHVYILAGGLGGMGLEVAQFLINRGATKLILTSRKGLNSGYQKRCYRSWIHDGVIVEISTLDICKYDQTEKLLIEANKLGPIGGIFNMTVALRDDLFELQLPEDFRFVCGSKVDGTYNLDIASRKLCSEDLKWFVFFSSIITSMGNYQQTAYGYANSHAEQIIRKRRDDGLPGLAIEWGAVGDVGIYFSIFFENKAVLSSSSMFPQRIVSCLQALDFFLCSNRSIVVSYVGAGKNVVTTTKEEDLAEAIARIMGVTNTDQIKDTSLLSELGLDSLMAVELKHTVEQHGINLSMKDIRQVNIMLSGTNFKPNTELADLALSLG